jgi:bacillithiol system protein YtxJ
MSFLKNLFNSNKPQKEPQKGFSWKPLTSVFQLDEIVEFSKTKTIVLFKHSTRCGISRMVLSRFEESLADNQKEVVFCFLDLLSFRDVSDEVAARFQVLHQSPQLLVIKNGSCVAHGSHYEILENKMKEIIIY